jgi:hypothetical protein
MFLVIFSTSSGGQVHNVAIVLILLSKRLSAGLQIDALKVKTVPLPHYILALMMMG